MKTRGVQKAGMIWLIFLLMAYFIPLDVETGGNYLVRDSLLGLMIFHQLWILGLYILIGLALIAWVRIPRIKLA